MGNPARNPHTVVELFDEQVRLTPSAVAVRQGDAALTYEDVAVQSRAVAQHLQDRSPLRESKVGVLLPRTVYLPGVLLGVLRSGAAFVPLDPGHPADRVDLILRDADVNVLITAEQGATPSGRWDVCELDVLLATRPQSAEAAVPEPDSVAYVLYTSGSTGVPKGVCVTGRSLGDRLAWAREWLGYRVGQRMLAVSTIAFDIALFEVFVPLVAGGELVLASDDDAKDPDALIDLLDTWRPDFMHATPALWQMLLYSGWRGDPTLTVLTGGDVVAPLLAEQLAKCTGGFLHLYGPTEATMFCLCDTTTEGQNGLLPLGQTAAGVKVYVLDDQLQVVPPGEVGQLCIAGAGLASGYLGRPDLTAERFVMNPHASAPGERLYLTGDLARRLPDNRIVLCGRNDRQVKVRGHRVELGEVERVILGTRSVYTAAVVLAGDKPENHRLIAYLRLASHEVSAVGFSLPDIVEEIHLRILRLLPRYMIPSSYVVMDTLPLTSNGKVDVKALQDAGSGEVSGTAVLWRYAPLPA
jgi:amino acid adenylation domain-containing protein